MTPYTIERDIEINAPIDVVWLTITEPEQVRTWFSSGVDLEARPGALGTLTFDPQGADAPMVVEITVVAVERPHHFSFRWVYPAGSEATSKNSTLVTFTLTRDGDEQTTLRVAETGLEEMEMPDADKRAFVEEHGKGWQMCGERLQALFLESPPGP